MSKTVILDEDERDRRMVNHLNEILRHCRIGRVEQKVKPVPVLTPTWGIFSRPDLTDALKPVMFMPKCGCRVGSACGNVACPHAARGTCIDEAFKVPSYGVLM